MLEENDFDGDDQSSLDQRPIIAIVIAILIFCLAASCIVIGYFTGTSGLFQKSDCPTADHTGPAFDVGVTTDLAVGSTATQISGDTAALAVDVDGIGGDTCSYTLGNDLFPWLCVKLEKMSLVEEIVIRKTRSVAPGVRYDNLMVRVGNYEECFGDKNFYYNNICGEYKKYSQKPNSKVLKFNCTSHDLVGKYVSVQIYKDCNQCVLSICQLEIYGYAIYMT
uniref:Fucolectin tachylectin-4 pentraxin-1 domain-containing protein n=1 Tax=Strigamia maritima TaxID=126957 RepID=T1J0S6_STRMM